MRVTVVPYDETWPASFERVAGRLMLALSDVDILAIEHVGSTSVPGLAAKPVLDIDVVVVRRDLAAAVEALERVGYTSSGDLGIPDRIAMAAPDERPRRNVYVVVEGSLALRNHLGVRTVLRDDRGLRERYAALKTSLAAADLPDMHAYIAAKSTLLGEILEQAGLDELEREEILAHNAAP